MVNMNWTPSTAPLSVGLVFFSPFEKLSENKVLRERKRKTRKKTTFCLCNPDNGISSCLKDKGRGFLLSYFFSKTIHALVLDDILYTFAG